MVTLKKVLSDDVYETVHSFITDNKVSIEDYSGMVNTILRMIKSGYCFAMDRDILRDAMECLTYMYSPSDDMNKDRVIQQLVDDVSDESDDENDTEDEFGNMDLLKMMQMMGGQLPASPPEEEIVVKKESDSKCCDGKKCVVGESKVDTDASTEDDDKVVTDLTEESIIPEK